MAKKIYGNMGKILRVDLTKGTYETEDATKYYKDWIGGRALNHILIFRGVDVAKVDPMSPENMIVISTGALGATTMPSSGRTQASFISPHNLSGWGDTNCGGHFGPALKTAGYDALVITGKSLKPVYIFINDNKVEFVPAGDLWGKGTIDTQASFIHKYGEDAKSLCIGQAGENLVTYACLRTELTNAMGRTGGGCVFGSKNLKAVVALGTKPVRLARPKEFLKVTKKLRDAIMDPKMGKGHALTYNIAANYGTPGFNKLIGATGMVPMRNWQKCGIDPKYDELITEWYDKYGVRREACFGCPIHCHATYAVNSGKYPTRGGGPEYETMNALGQKCDITDAKAVLKGNTMCNDYGLDTVETGNMIATLMELRERGIIDKKFTDGINLVFGNQDAMVRIIPKIALSDGCGKKLSKSPYHLAKSLGKNALKSVNHQKGMGPTGVNIAATVGAILSFSVSPRGAHHLSGLPTAEWVNIPPLAIHCSGGYKEAGELLNYHPKGKANIVKYYEDLFTIVDSLGICKFTYGHLPLWHDTVDNLELMWKLLIQALNAATGLDYTKEDLLKAAEKSYQIERATIVMRGMRRKDDMPTDKVLSPTPGNHPLNPVPLPGVDLKKYNKVLDAYYDVRGWDKEGIPKASHLKKLGLKEIADKQTKTLST